MSTDANAAPSLAAVTPIRQRFASTFWVANTLELFERLAYYGQNAVLAVYLTERVGLGERGSTLAGIFTGVLYTMPILAGTLVDRFGFRRCLLACFLSFALGYLAIGLAGMPAGQPLVQAVGAFPYMCGALLFTAVGGSLIKPCIVGTVANTTNAESKALGYSIYYTLVNLGGAIGPLIALQVRRTLGIEYVLLTSALTAVALFVGAFLFFREPERSEDAGPPRSLTQVLLDLGTVIRNQRFVLFLVIFSGFWVMFWQIFLSLTFYIKDVLRYDAYEALTSVDAWAIIALQVGVTALTRRLRPILAMSAGFAISSASWLLLTLGSSPWLVVLALLVFAIGETTQAPRYYEYVAALAPKNQVGTYMGFAFLPVAIGAYVGGPLATFLMRNYMHGPRPASMWAAVAMIGFTATLLLVVYDRLLHREEP